MGVVALIRLVEFYSQLNLLKLNGVRLQFDIVTMIRNKAYQNFLNPKIYSLFILFYLHTNKTHSYLLLQFPPTKKKITPTLKEGAGHDNHQNLQHGGKRATLCLGFFFYSITPFTLIRGNLDKWSHI